MSKRTEALASIKAMDDTIITAEDAAAALGVNPQSIRLQAKEDPNALGFNVIRIGCSTLIPRVPFVRYLEGAM